MKNKYNIIILALCLFLHLPLGIANLAIPDSNDLWIDSHLQAIKNDAVDLDEKVLRLALSNYKNTLDNKLTKSSILSVVDYTKKSGIPRFWVIDLNQDKVLFHELVAHGKNSGDHYFATSFSNKSGSLKSSLGIFLTGQTYIGKHGYSMTLEGLQKGINDNVLKRRVVLHGAHYVNDAIAQTKGHIGRSFGCLSVRPQISRKIIDAIKDGSVIYSYHPSLLA